MLLFQNVTEEASNNIVAENKKYQKKKKALYFIHAAMRSEWHWPWND